MASLNAPNSQDQSSQCALGRNDIDLLGTKDVAAESLLRALHGIKGKVLFISKGAGVYRAVPEKNRPNLFWQRVLSLFCMGAEPEGYYANSEVGELLERHFGDDGKALRDKMNTGWFRWKQAIDTEEFSGAIQQNLCDKATELFNTISEAYDPSELSNFPKAHTKYVAYLKDVNYVRRELPKLKLDNDTLTHYANFLADLKRNWSQEPSLIPEFDPNAGQLRTNARMDTTEIKDLVKRRADENQQRDSQRPSRHNSRPTTPNRQPEDPGIASLKEQFKVKAKLAARQKQIERDQARKAQLASTENDQLVESQNDPQQEVSGSDMSMSNNDPTQDEVATPSHTLEDRKAAALLKPGELKAKIAFLKMQIELAEDRNAQPANTKNDQLVESQHDPQPEVSSSENQVSNTGQSQDGDGPTKAIETANESLSQDNGPHGGLPTGRRASIDLSKDENDAVNEAQTQESAPQGPPSTPATDEANTAYPSSNATSNHAPEAEIEETNQTVNEDRESLERVHVKGTEVVGHQIAGHKDGMKIIVTPDS